MSNAGQQAGVYGGGLGANNNGQSTSSGYVGSNSWQPKQEKNTKEKKEGSSTPILVGVIIALVVVIAVGGIMIYTRNNDKARVADVSSDSGYDEDDNSESIGYVRKKVVA